MAIYTVIQAIYTVSTPYFPTLFQIQNIGYLHVFCNALSNLKTGYLHLSRPHTSRPPSSSLPFLSSATAHIYLTLLAHTPAYSLALSISMLCQCPAQPQSLNSRPKSLAVGIAARIALADWRELGARITTLL